MSKYSVNPRKKMGQSFLKSEKVARSIADAAMIAPTDSILEIGGGLGILTLWLARSAKKVTVVELDKGLVKALKNNLSDFENVEVIQGDALKIPLPDTDKIVSNLPYSISSEITFKFLKDVKFDLAVLMFQKEFAQRLLAVPESSVYSRLSIDFQYLGTAEYVRDVKAGNFYPVPSVDSTILKITKRSTGPVAKNPDVFFWMINGLYSYPNKQLKKALKIWFKRLGYPNATDIFLSKIGDLDPTLRLRALPLESLTVMADIVQSMIEDGDLPTMG
ncbi:MAG: 16S rRNA (adenine(1518)-N(6)/adenine(1519)-N(6))-dimethyltransferase RsmA [Candidatus Thorarchaeota archaeon]|nr:16S rRNA (adenine(1518)-N(6)/adenine(1519)-N(6))-dimethyltransferase RsmA [Candidatus Thorarchaeota archaeon]